MLVALLVGCSGSTPESIPAGAAGPSVGSRPSSTPEPFYGMSNSDVLLHIRADVAAATSVHIASWEIDGAKKTRDANLKMNRSGRCFGTVVTKGSTVTLRRLGPVLYLKAGRDYWAYLGESRASRLTNRWIRVRRGFSKEVDQYFAMTRPEFWLKEWTDPTGVEDLFRETGILLDGVQTTALLEGDVSLASTGGLFFASTGPSLPREVRFGAPNQDLFKFRGWNTTAVNVVAPKHAFDPETLGLVGE